MKILVLSRKASLYSTGRLIDAARERGVDAEVVDYLRCCLTIVAHRPAVTLKGMPIEGVDAVIPRIGASNTFYGTAVVRQFEMTKVYSVNESQAIARSRDKLRSLQILSREGIGMPITTVAHSTKDIEGLIDTVGDAPLIVKLIEGTQGIGVVLCETRSAAKSVIEAFRGLDANILVQEFIAESKGADLRAFVVGRKVVAAMKRQGAPGEFRSNIHRGGSSTAIKLTPEERTTAVRAARALGLRVAGVDLLRSNHGPVVMEVNSSPGLEGIENATGIDVAGKIIDFIINDAKPGRTKDGIKV